MIIISALRLCYYEFLRKSGHNPIFHPNFQKLIEMPFLINTVIIFQKFILLFC